ncbi:transposase [Rufibacter radiotolerans]|uniref:transposase n=1 Tax=Rufibacter radiotolerans TaxID=1379910 RepID=UPI0006647CC8|nr:transposase [Rufibacter radiotolerans]
MARYDTFSKNNRRLADYDYRCEGLYFITICTQDRWPFFGDVKNGQMELSDEGLVAQDYWLELEQHWSRVFLGEFVVMPNHIHGILGLEGSAAESPLKKENDLEVLSAASKAEVRKEMMATISPKSGSISRIVGSYKAACTKMIRSMSNKPFGWQPRFHDRVVRSQRELVQI